MPRLLTIAAAQLGPIPRTVSRRKVLQRLIDLLIQAAARGSDLVVFPECTLTSFFPHWWIEDLAELDSYFERSMPGADTQPLFDEAARLQIGFCLCYAELSSDGGRVRRFNSAVLVERDGRVVGHYRKVHLPGHCEHRPGNPFQNLTRRLQNLQGGNLPGEKPSR